ncbi:hypothetical protein E0L93_02010 [Rubrobacter taiwanensis]|uniref:Uncharacterized protein n=1 Tax=Rubrobacter taiwanensis TaxID=185139 RepID=A0A4R1BRA9_9ACTN|nr:hypothetical protein [Rubrobacter taiwanensis]TCJ20303.1 hypothetical protein E0L93_02010 [Rubrobacter taiwanensis]
MSEKTGGLRLPDRVRQSIAAAAAEQGPQARVVAAQTRTSMRPPQAHVVVAAERRDIERIRGRVSLVRRLELYKTSYGPVVRLALSAYPPDGEPLSAAAVLDVAQVSGDAVLTGLGKQKDLYLHFYRAESGDLVYEFSKQLSNDEKQRGEARRILRMARGAYGETPAERRSFRRAVALAGRQFELPVPPPERAPDAPPKP